MILPHPNKGSSAMPPEEVNKAVFSDFVKDNWAWDDQHTPDEVQLSHDKAAAYFNVDPVEQSMGTLALRGCHGFAEGEHYWEVVFLEPPTGSSVMVGVGTTGAELRLDQSVNLIGRDEESWGLSYKGQIYHAGAAGKYCEPFFAQNTVIGIHLDLTRGHLTFYKDGHCLGLAFTGLRASRQKRLYPMISSTASETELGLGRRVRQLSQPSGLGSECMSVVMGSLSCMEDLESLPLPEMVKRCMRDS